MADATSRKKLKEIRSQCGNNICVECGKLNPQWERIAFLLCNNFRNVLASCNFSLFKSTFTFGQKSLDMTPLSFVRPFCDPIKDISDVWNLDVHRM